jgi:hypothetical protein
MLSSHTRATIHSLCVGFKGSQLLDAFNCKVGSHWQGARNIVIVALVVAERSAQGSITMSPNSSPKTTKAGKQQEIWIPLQGGKGRKTAGNLDTSTGRVGERGLFM